jgi:Galactosyltransferase
MRTGFLRLQYEKGVFIRSQPIQSEVRSTTFLLGIFCTLQDVMERTMIRDTIIGEHLPPDINKRICSLQNFLSNFEVKSSCNLIYTFVIGGNNTGLDYFDRNNDLLVTNHNMTAENDLTILNIKENMNNGKTPSWFNYASEIMKGDIDYVAKSDRDTLISVPALFQFVDTHLPSQSQHGNPRIYGGKVADIINCGGPRFSHCRKIEGKFFMLGQFYFVSHDIVMMKQLWMKSNYSAPHEDLDFALRIWHGYSLFHAIILDSENFWIHGLKNSGRYRRMFAKIRSNDWNI